MCGSDGLCSAPTACEDDASCIAEFGAGFACDEGENACFGPGDGEVVPVAADIETDQTWTAGQTYRLDEVVFVSPGVTLTIEAGANIQGVQGSALVVRRGARLEARGTAAAPIVFTSAQPEGSRAPGDWGGLALLGSASTNEDAPSLEGIAAGDERSEFGGSDDESSCGVLEYVRVEYAGFAIELGSELNGLTLAGCGSGTIIDFVQVHQGDDDGIEVFGGTVDLRHIVITRAQDDSLDWDLGWRGTAQFLAIQQDTGGDNGFEASSGEDGATPFASPRVYNTTLIGSGQSGSNRGINFKDSTRGTVANTIFLGHGLEALDVQGEPVVANIQSESLIVEGAVFFNAGTDGEHFFPTVEDETEMSPGDERNDDGGFDEDGFFRGLDFALGVDPGLPDAFNLTAPGWVPSASVVTEAAVAPPPGFDEGARYCGAFAPNQPAWTTGWTDYSAN